MKKLLFLTSCFLASVVYGQQANDCVDAITVCGTTAIATNSSGVGVQELDAATNPCISQEINSLWIRVVIETAGSLAFTLRPDNTGIEVDYDFYIFGPNTSCGDFDTTLRCSTTNPQAAGQANNLTGLNDTEEDQNEGPGQLGNSFVSSIDAAAGDWYYILINRPVGTGGFTLEWTGTAIFPEAPAVNQPQDVLVCEDQTATPIDLTVQEASLADASLSFDYFTSYEDAFDLQNQIADPTQFSYPGSTTPIFIRVANTNGCFDIVDFTITTASFAEPPSFGYEACDGNRDNQASFLTQPIFTDINSIFSAPNYLVSLHANATDAATDSNPITDASYTVGSTTTIYAKVRNAQNTGCSISFPIDLEVNPPAFPEVIRLVQCDVDPENSLDGITIINLTQAFVNAPSANILFYETQEDRQANNPITNASRYTNTSAFATTLYYKAQQPNCETLGEIAIEVNATTASLHQVSPIQACDENPNDAVLESTFNIDTLIDTYFNGLEIALYETLEDAALEQNPLGGNFTSTATTLYTRLENNNECLRIEALALLVNPLPVTNLSPSYQVCTNGPPLSIQAPQGYDQYTWYQTDGDQPVVIGTNSSILIRNAGRYSLEVSTQDTSLANAIYCSTTSDFVVSASSRPNEITITLPETFNTATVLVNASGNGDYEYSLDGENYQDSPVFEALENGFYTVYVNDQNGCGSAQEDFSVVGFPKFFSPNGDGINDYWQIIGSNTPLENKSIFIYDRFGKLLKQLNTNDRGWDGTYNGTPLPATEYWFYIDLENGKNYKSHFSLKR